MPSFKPLAALHHSRNLLTSSNSHWLINCTFAWRRFSYVSMAPVIEFASRTISWRL